MLGTYRSIEPEAKFVESGMHQVTQGQDVGERVYLVAIEFIQDLRMTERHQGEPHALSKVCLK